MPDGLPRGIGEAGQCLEAGEPAAVQVDDRLVADGQLRMAGPAVVKCDVQGSFGGGPLEDARPKRVVERRDAVLATLLRPVHGHVCVA
jgi:hypothetical protein